MLKKAEYMAMVKKERALEVYELISNMPESLQYIHISYLPGIYDILNRYLNGTGDIVDCEYTDCSVTFHFAKNEVVDEEVVSYTEAKSYKVSNNGIIVIDQVSSVYYWKEKVPVIIAKTKITFNSFSKDEKQMILHANIILNDFYSTLDFQVKSEGGYKYYFRDNLDKKLAINLEKFKNEIDSGDNYQDEMIRKIIDEYDIVFKSLEKLKKCELQLRP